MSILFDPIVEVDFQLGVNLAPILAATGPFLGYVDHGQAQDFQEAIVSGENRLAFCDFSELAIESFNGIGGIDQFSDLFRVFKISR